MAPGTELCPLPALRRKGPSGLILSSPIKGGENPRLDQKQAGDEAACGDRSRDTPALKSENGRTRKRLLGSRWHSFLHLLEGTGGPLSILSWHTALAYDYKLIQGSEGLHSTGQR